MWTFVCARIELDGMRYVAWFRLKVLDLWTQYLQSTLRDFCQIWLKSLELRVNQIHFGDPRLLRHYILWGYSIVRILASMRGTLETPAYLWNRCSCVINSVKLWQTCILLFTKCNNIIQISSYYSPKILHFNLIELVLCICEHMIICTIVILSNRVSFGFFQESWYPLHCFTLVWLCV